MDCLLSDCTLALGYTAETLSGQSQSCLFDQVVDLHSLLKDKVAGSVNWAAVSQLGLEA